MAGQPLELRDFFAVLMRQRRIILLTLVLSVALAWTALLLLRPTYTAAALVMVDPSHKDLLDPGLPSGGTQPTALALTAKCSWSPHRRRSRR